MCTCNPPTLNGPFVKPLEPPSVHSVQYRLRTPGYNRTSFRTPLPSRPLPSPLEYSIPSHPCCLVNKIPSLILETSRRSIMNEILRDILESLSLSLWSDNFLFEFLNFYKPLPFWRNFHRSSDSHPTTASPTYLITTTLSGNLPYSVLLSLQRRNDSTVLRSVGDSRLWRVE